jgi:protein tyrosine/serine phosphatase
MACLRRVLPIALVLIGCATARDEHRAAETPSIASAMHRLQSEGAPARFARVDERVYRGGQPTEEHLRLLHAIGVTKIVDLRRERLDVRRAERAAARELGMEFVELPFFGVFGADLDFLTRAIDELRTHDGGAVYIHCDNGRDRTSLVVALYRLVHDEWSPERAWQHEVLAYGHESTPVLREIRLTFDDYALEHGARIGTRAVAPDRERALAELVGGKSGPIEGELVDAGGPPTTD